MCALWFSQRTPLHQNRRFPSASASGGPRTPPFPPAPAWERSWDPQACLSLSSLTSFLSACPLTDGVFGRCQELPAIDRHHDEVSPGVLRHLTAALQKLSRTGTRSRAGSASALCSASSGLWSQEDTESASVVMGGEQAAWVTEAPLGLEWSLGTDRGSSARAAEHRRCRQGPWAEGLALDPGAVGRLHGSVATSSRASDHPCETSLLLLTVVTLVFLS